MKHLLLAIGLASIFSSGATGQVLFEDNFEGDLAQWLVVGYGVITADPVDPGNSALSFSSTDDSGNMYSPTIAVDDESTYSLTFRYLGTNLEGSGGYLWLLDPANPYDPSCPVFGTSVENSTFQLIDNGEWAAYELIFTISDFWSETSGELQITIEDWNGAAGGDWAPPNIPGDAFFDDVKFERVDPIGIESVSWGSIKSLFD